jgi:hypothetical protein
MEARDAAPMIDAVISKGSSSSGLVFGVSVGSKVVVLRLIVRVVFVVLVEVDVDVVVVEVVAIVVAIL